MSHVESLKCLAKAKIIATENNLERLIDLINSEYLIFVETDQQLKSFKEQYHKDPTSKDLIQLIQINKFLDKLTTRRYTFERDKVTDYAATALKLIKEWDDEY